ncbi:MAG: nucleotidyltransferase [Nitrospirae bacterium]|nr:nucleotidyltransferase [Nitrospirota bacterium]
MEKALKVLNGLERKGVIERYAIGGSIAVLFYAEPVLTYDLDVFVFLPETQSGLLSLSPLYEFLREKGYNPKREHVVIEGVPVQFIPAYNDLVEEAVAEARETKLGRTRTRVIRVEHLLAILLQTGRPKDYARMVHLLDESKIDRADLSDILGRHGLRGKWSEFRRRFHGT